MENPENIINRHFGPGHFHDLAAVIEQVLHRLAKFCIKKKIKPFRIHSTSMEPENFYSREQWGKYRAFMEGYGLYYRLVDTLYEKLDYMVPGVRSVLHSYIHSQYRTLRQQGTNPADVAVDRLKEILMGILPPENSPGQPAAVETFDLVFTLLICHGLTMGEVTGVI